MPDQINLSNPDFASQYAQASYTTSIGQTFRGGVIQYSIAPLRRGNTRAADEVIYLLDSPQGADLVRQFGFRRIPSWPEATSTTYLSRSDARSRAHTTHPDHWR